MNFLAANQIIEVLIRAGADVAQVLFFSPGTRSFEVLADVAQLNDYGRTALHYAAMQGNY
jgi:ankyrin repeat protein